MTWPSDEGPVPRNIFCSAPDIHGRVIVAGLSGAVPRGDRLRVTDSVGSNTDLTVSADGSFAGWVYAHSQENLSLVAHQSNGVGHSIDVVVTTGLPSGYTGPVDGLVLGEAAEVSAPDDEGQVLVHGNGDLLRSGSAVIGANLSDSTAATTMASCSPSCAFDLFLPGSAGDKLGIFLVVSGQQGGYTAPETTTVP